MARTPENNPNQDIEVQFNFPEIEIEPEMIELKVDDERLLPILVTAYVERCLD
ncbi:hypothetical protein [Crateriforma conspicua]|uniref:hypothetical protein n=1 Tax=Crateriforma conspicua TaxID=2527996 RepID=UPI0018CF69F7|nr:hypothetical protein [Crateriforma conspicua]